MATDKDFLTQPKPLPAHLCFLMLTGSRGPGNTAGGWLGEGQLTCLSFSLFESLSFHSHIIKSGIHCVFVFFALETKGAICLWFFYHKCLRFFPVEIKGSAGWTTVTLRRERCHMGRAGDLFSQEYCRVQQRYDLSDGISVRIK